MEPHPRFPTQIIKLGRDGAGFGGSSTMPGFAEFLAEYFEYHNFEVKVVASNDGQFGSKHASHGHWNGVLGDVTANKVNLTQPFFALNYQRISDFRYSFIPCHHVYYGFLFNMKTLYQRNADIDLSFQKVLPWFCWGFLLAPLLITYIPPPGYAAKHFGKSLIALSIWMLAVQLCISNIILTKALLDPLIPFRNTDGALQAVKMGQALWVVTSNMYHGSQKHYGNLLVEMNRNYKDAIVLVPTFKRLFGQINKNTNFFAYGTMNFLLKNARFGSVAVRDEGKSFGLIGLYYSNKFPKQLVEKAAGYILQSCERGIYQNLFGGIDKEVLNNVKLKSGVQSKHFFLKEIFKTWLLVQPGLFTACIAFALEVAKNYCNTHVIRLDYKH